MGRINLLRFLCIGESLLMDGWHLLMMLTCLKVLVASHLHLSLKVYTYLGQIKFNFSQSKVGIPYIYLISLSLALIRMFLFNCCGWAEKLWESKEQDHCCSCKRGRNLGSKIYGNAKIKLNFQFSCIKIWIRETSCHFLLSRIQLTKYE